MMAHRHGPITVILFLLSAPHTMGFSLISGDLSAAIAVTAGYDDNVYRAEQDEQADQSANIAPRLDWRLATRRHVLHFNYEAELIRYRDLTDENTVQHHAGAGLDLFSSGPCRLILGYTFVQNRTPPNDELTEPTTRTEQLAAATLIVRSSYRLKLKLALDAGNRHFAEVRLQDQDRDRWAIDGELNILLGSRSAAVAGYQVTRHDFPDRRDDALNTTTSAGIEFTGSVKLHLRCLAGIETRKWTGGDRETVSDPVYNVLVEYKPHSYQALRLGFQRRLLDSFYRDNRTYRSDMMYSVFEHESHWAFIRLHAWYHLNGYTIPTAEEASAMHLRKDHMFGFETKYKHRIAVHHFLSAGYVYTSRSSNFAMFDYRENTFFLGWEFQLD